MNDLMTYINQSIVKAMDDTVDKEVREIIAEEIDFAYSEFDEHVYMRRYNEIGGFADPNMIETQENLKRDGYSLTYTNEALANGDDEGDRLDYIIEYGEDYKWNSQPPPRPVMARSQERIKDENIIEKSLKVGLKKYGIEVE